MICHIKRHCALYLSSAAWKFVDDHLGIDYGWEIVLMGLLDTPHGNEICTDSDKNYCVTAEHFELIFSIIQNITDAARVYKPAIMQRYYRA